MAKKNHGDLPDDSGAGRASASVDELLLAALARGDESGETGRYIVTFKEGAGEEGLAVLRTQGLRVADARDFEAQAVAFEGLGDADTVVFPEIGVALVGADAARQRGLGVQTELATDGPLDIVEAERFVFAESYTRGIGLDPNPGAHEDQDGFAHLAETPNPEYLRGFLRATELIAEELHPQHHHAPEQSLLEEVTVLGATWGLTACKVPTSLRSGLGIRVAVLDTGMDLGHPDFAGRSITTTSFVGQPVQDLQGHGTHITGTACGPKAPAGSTPRYGIGYRTGIFAGKVLSNAGSGSSGSVLAGMNWAVANNCQSILLAIGGAGGPLAAYTAAGQAALNRGLLMIAAAGSSGGAPGAPANSPTIMSVAALDRTLRPAAFSNFGKIDLAAPGVDIFSSSPRPARYRTSSGTSMAAAHVAGCAALWAESAPGLRGMALWRKLLATARRLSFPAARVGAGLVQAP